MWLVEVWIRPVKDEKGHLLCLGRWRKVGPAESFEEAKEAVVQIADQHGVARATRADGAEMRAYVGRGFHWWRPLDER